MPRIAIAIFALFSFVGCIKPEARSLKHPDPPQLAADWSSWQRPGFSIAAPDNWSPYSSRVLQPLPPREDELPGSQPGTGWAILDKDGDELRIEELGKQGIPLRLYDNARQGATLTVKLDLSEDTTPNELAKYRRSLGDTLMGDSKLELPVGTAYEFHIRAQGYQSKSYLLINGSDRYVLEFAGAPPELAREIMATLRVKG
jgi:hypothetical protein